MKPLALQQFQTLDLATAEIFLTGIELHQQAFRDPARVHQWYDATSDLFSALLCLIARRVECETGRVITLAEMMQRIRSTPHGAAVQDFFNTLDGASEEALRAIPSPVKRQLIHALLSEAECNFVAIASRHLGDATFVRIGIEIGQLVNSVGRMPA